MTANPVPVEHRVLGLDKRKLGGTAAVLALVVLWAVLTPFIDSKIPYDNEVAAGQTFDVGSGVTIVPRSDGTSMHKQR